MIDENTNSFNDEEFKEKEKFEIIYRNTTRKFNSECTDEGEKKTVSKKKNFKSVLGKGVFANKAKQNFTFNNSYYQKIKSNISNKNFYNRSNSERNLVNEKVEHMKNLLSKHDDDNISIKSLKVSGFAMYFTRSSSASRTENFLKESKSFRNSINKDLLTEKKKKEDLEKLKEIEKQIQLEKKYLLEKSKKEKKFSLERNSITKEKRSSVDQNIKNNNKIDITKSDKINKLNKTLNSLKNKKIPNFEKEFIEAKEICNVIKEKGIDKINDNITFLKQIKKDLENNIKKLTERHNLLSKQKMQYSIKAVILEENNNKYKSNVVKIENSNKEFDMLQLECDINKLKIDLKEKLDANKTLKNDLKSNQDIINTSNTEITKLKKGVSIVNKEKEEIMNQICFFKKHLKSLNEKKIKHEKNYEDFMKSIKTLSKTAEVNSLKAQELSSSNANSGVNNIEKIEKNQIQDERKKNANK